MDLMANEQVVGKAFVNDAIDIHACVEAKQRRWRMLPIIHRRPRPPAMSLPLSPFGYDMVFQDAKV